jgi:hypothetical protein
MTKEGATRAGAGESFDAVGAIYAGDAAGMRAGATGAGRAGRVTRLIQSLVGAFAPGRQFELWEAVGETRPFMMVASDLTRREAVSAARLCAAGPPPRRALVLDARGRPVFRI